MEKGFRRLMMAFGIAAAVHATAIFSPELLRHRAMKPTMTRQVVHEEIRISETQKKPDPAPLEEERKQYIAELLTMLKNGKRVLLSDFLIKSQILDENIELARGKQPLIKESDVKGKYFQLAEEAKKEVIGKENKIEELHHYLHTKVFAGYFWGSGSILDVIDRGWYNCLSSTEMFSALLEDVLGEEQYKVLLFDDHAATFLKGMVIENTADTWKEAHKSYSGCGLAAPSDIFVAAYLVKHGISEEEFPPRIAAIYKSRAVWKGCPKKGKNKMAESLKGGGFPVVGVGSGFPEPPLEFIPNPYFEVNSKRIVSLAKGLLAAYQMSHIYDEKGFMKTKMKDRDLLVKPIQIPENVDWGELLERMKEQLEYSHIVPFLPEKVQCCVPIMSICPHIVPEIIESVSMTGNKKFDYYNKESICGRYEKAIENGTFTELKRYFPFSFCTALNAPLRKRYLGEKNGSILWFGLGNMEIADNFDFFLDELKSENPEIKESAAAALLLTDATRACKVFNALREEDKIPVSTILGWGCTDKETAWKNIIAFRDSGIKNNEDHRLETALAVIDGKDMDRHQYEILKSISKNVPLCSKPDLARIFYEYGDKKAAEECIKDTVERLAHGEDIANFWLCNIPSEYIHLFFPLLKEKPNLAVGVANNLICNEEHREHIPQLVEPLLAILQNAAMTVERRIKAAFTLLRLGVDPLKK